MCYFNNHGNKVAINASDSFVTFRIGHFRKCNLEVIQSDFPVPFIHMICNPGNGFGQLIAYPERHPLEECNHNPDSGVNHPFDFFIAWPSHEWVTPLTVGNPRESQVSERLSSRIKRNVMIQPKWILQELQSGVNPIH